MGVLSGTLNSIREERARLARDVEYIREMAAEDFVDDRMLYLEDSNMASEINLYKESAELINQIPGEDDFSGNEISRILNADHDLTFDEMIGI